jgi:uncharacterized protein YjiS (DUF1127 family)
MSVQAIGNSEARIFHPRPNAFSRLVGLVRAILESRRAEQEINGLSEHHLRDIGIDRPQLSEVARREAAIDFLIESGWPPSHRARRR